MKKAAILCALIVASVAAPGFAQQVSITVNGQALAISPGPIERTGRVFVPLRGIFERLGAAVVYSAGTINATKGSTTVSLRIGSTQATVNGQIQNLDVAPFIVGATTYVPLRFIAQSLGANVGYDSATRVVAIEQARPVPPPMPLPDMRLRNQRPEPGSEITNRFAIIAADFSRDVFADSIRVWIDGANRTMQSGVSSTGFSFKPPAPLDFGSHTVRVAGRARDGSGFDRSWSFRVARSSPQPIALTITDPGNDTAVPRNFTLQGSTAPNATVRVTAGASPSWSGQFNGTTTAGPRGNFSLDVSLTTMPGQQTVTVRITATDPVTLRTAEQTLRLRLSP
jgi:hypothetical protein